MIRLKNRRAQTDPRRTCVPAAIANVFRHYGEGAWGEESRVIERYRAWQRLDEGSDPEFSLFPMPAFLEAQPDLASRYQFADHMISPDETLDLLKDAVARDTPMIVSMHLERGGAHMVLVTDCDDSTVRFDNQGVSDFDQTLPVARFAVQIAAPGGKAQSLEIRRR